MATQSTADCLQIIMENLESFNRNLKLKILSAEDLSVLTKHHLNYLQAIRELGSPTFGELALALAVTKPSVTSIINKLINVDFVIKEQSKEDKRIYYIHLTAKGKAVMEAYNKAYSEFLTGLIQSLDPQDIQTFDRLVRSLSARLERGEGELEQSVLTTSEEAC